MNEFILQLENITKIYPNGFVANDKINMNVRRGEIHALLGENGAGKTTLMKVLFGIEGHEEGRVLLNGEPVVIKSPQHAIDMGIGMVHQHFMLVPSMTTFVLLILDYLLFLLLPQDGKDDQSHNCEDIRCHLDEFYR